MPIRGVLFVLILGISSVGGATSIVCPTPGGEIAKCPGAPSSAAGPFRLLESDAAEKPDPTKIGPTLIAGFLVIKESDAVDAAISDIVEFYNVDGVGFAQLYSDGAPFPTIPTDSLQIFSFEEVGDAGKCPSDITSTPGCVQYDVPNLNGGIGATYIVQSDIDTGPEVPEPSTTLLACPLILILLSHLRRTVLTR